VKITQISQTLRKDAKMKTKIDGQTFIVFNRDTTKGEFDHRGKGRWHWGLEDQDGKLWVSRWGLETEQNAMNMMDAYTWALRHDHGLMEQYDSELTLLPEGTVVDATIRMTFHCPETGNEDYRQSESFARAREEFVAAATKRLAMGWPDFFSDD
jgi:hypothetical protein